VAIVSMATLLRRAGGRTIDLLQIDAKGVSLRLGPPFWIAAFRRKLRVS
jgi:hypothetical protein